MPHPRHPAAQGEHGTGRNVAPYVEMEWGSKAYELMWELKEMFDPDYVLNPGVILNKARPALPAATHLSALPHRSVDVVGNALQSRVCWCPARPTLCVWTGGSL